MHDGDTHATACLPACMSACLPSVPVGHSGRRYWEGPLEAQDVLAPVEGRVDLYEPTNHEGKGKGWRSDLICKGKGWRSDLVLTDIDLVG